MEKFKVGQKVYCIRYGLGEVIISADASEEYPIYVLFSGNKRDSFTTDGKPFGNYLNPTLLTLEEARAKGYDVPKQKIVKEKTVYINLYGDGERSYIHDTEENAKANARIGDSKLLATAYPVTIKYKVEE